jgi:hypothetical protein
MLPPVFQTLKASSEVRAFVGPGSPRIYRHGEAPQDMRTLGPYITWFLVAGVPDNNLSDTPPSDRLTTQIDCWHAEDKGIELMARAVRDAVEPVAHVTAINSDTRDPETQLFRISLQVDFIQIR